MADTDDIDKIFKIVDSDGSGYVDREKLQRICPHLSTSEIDMIFNDLDTDHDNRISLKEFKHGFKGFIPSNDRYSIDKEEDLITDFTEVQIKDVFNNLSCQEQIYDFYETLRNKSSESVEQFQSILETIVYDIIKYRKEIKRLDDSYRREKEMNAKFLKRIEEDQERDMRQLEERIRKEEQQKFELERQLVQQRSSKQISDLQSNLKRLQTVEQCYLDRQSSEDSLTILLREEISKLTQENQTINSSLNESLTTITILKSDLQSLKTQLNERQALLSQEKHTSSNIYREKESLAANIRQLVEVNKHLRDENDTLRATIESNKSSNAISDIPLGSRRSMSRTGSILEAYWNNNNPKIDYSKSSPNVSTTQQKPNHLKTLDSFDLESTDELGINEHKILSKPKLDAADISSQKILPLTSNSSLINNVEKSNFMNDSGLSLTTIRDVTEQESDRELKSNEEVLIKNSKQNRSIGNKRNNDDTDSDGVFEENSFDRNNSKRWSHQRSLKRTSSSGRSSLKYSVSQSLSNNFTSGRKQSESTMNEIQSDSITSNLPFDRMYKVVFCGDAAVGKSTLIMRLCKGKFVSNINSTLGVDFQNKQLVIDSKRIAIQLWDTAGQERFRSIAKSYFRRCDGVILVYDTTYERSFLNVREWIDTISESTPKKVSVMIVGNKIDLRDQMRAEGKRVIEHDDGFKLAKEYQALFIETSAKDGTNSDEALIELARDMQCNEDLERYRTSGINLDKTTKKSTCCGGRS